MEIDYAAIGKRIKMFRKQKGIPQEHLAEELGISVPHMSNIENGKTQFSLAVLFDLITALDVTADMLLFGQAAMVGNVQGMVLKEIDGLFAGCSEVQVQLMMDSMRNTKKVLGLYDSKMNKKGGDEG